MNRQLRSRELSSDVKIYDLSPRREAETRLFSAGAETFHGLVLVAALFPSALIARRGTWHCRVDGRSLSIPPRDRRQNENLLAQVVL
jgi:hypothetical protein